MASTSTKNDFATRRRNHRSWPSMNFSAVWAPPPNVFDIRSECAQEDNEEDLKWAAIERLPTFDRMRKGVLKLALDNGKIVHCPIDVTNLGLQEKKLLLESMLKFVEEDNEKFLRGLRDRVNRCLSINISSSPCSLFLLL